MHEKETLESTEPVSERTQALAYMVDVYTVTARDALDFHANKWWLREEGVGPVTARKMLRCDINSRAFVKGSLRTYKRGGYKAMSAFQRNFKWRQIDG